jgi:transposase-like protein
MRSCPRCLSDKSSKDSIVKGRQRYKCKGCQFSFTVQQKSGKIATKEIKKAALNLYLEGLGFRSIGRILGFSHVAVYKWIKSFGEEIEQLQSKESIEVVEIDEMYSYIGSKKNTAGYGLLLIDIANGSSILTLDQEVLKREKYFGKSHKHTRYHIEPNCLREKKSSKSSKDIDRH